MVLRLCPLWIDKECFLCYTSFNLPENGEDTALAAALTVCRRLSTALLKTQKNLNGSMEEDQQFLLMVAKGIVNHPDDVTVERRVDEKGVLLTLHVNPADMGYAVGRRGKTAEALRTLLRIVGAKHNARVSIQIHDPNREAGAPMPMGDVDTSAVENLNI